MNRNPDKPLCCYRHYQKIAEDTGLSERYVSRIIEILDTIKKMKRARYKGSNDKVRFRTTPKIFADYRRFIKRTNGYTILDTEYDYNSEMSKQIELMRKENITL